MKSIMLILISVLLGSFGQISIKYGTMKLGVINGNIINILLKFLTNFYIFTGLFLYGLSAMLWVYIISKVELTYAYPMVALGYVFVSVLSVTLFKEAMPNLRVIGLSLIVLGVVLVAKSS